MSKKTHHRSSASFLTRVLPFLLIITIICSFSGCDQAPASLQNGLTVLPTADAGEITYTNEATQDVTAALYALLLHYASTVTPNLPDTTKATLALHADEIVKRIKAQHLTEARFSTLATLLNTHGTAAVDEYLAGSPKGDHIRALYLALTELMGQERLGQLTYQLLLYRHQYLATTARSRYKKYGYPHLLEEATRLEGELSILENDIGAAKFGTAFRMGIMLTDLLSSDTLKGQALSSFSLAEILLFLEYIPLQEIELSEQGWHFLLTLTLPSTPTDYRDRLLVKANENGDLLRIAASCDELLSLLTAARDRMSTDTARLLQAGERDTLLFELFHSLNEEERASFFALTAIDLTYDDYEAIALAEYGDTFTSYKESIHPANASEVCAADVATFVDTLTRYLAGISPVLTYQA